MKPLPHEYEVRLAGGPSGSAALSTDGVTSLSTAPPAEYDGPGDAWSPEHLLLASVEACFLFTLRANARMSNVAFNRLDVRATGTVDRQEGVTRFTEITLRATLSVPAITPRDQALRLLDRAKRSCLITASLATPVRVEWNVYQQGAPSADGPLQATA
jgi:organic hydroperoxide reductase OsmC/OhrA